MAHQGYCQLENAQWYFGTQAGLSFLSSPPTNLTNGVLTTAEGCASIADASGNLLFYTDGSTIYNKLHAAMANGTGLNGHSSTTQSAIIVKEPGSNTLYYVFSLGVGGSGSLNYSIVDMALAAGNGSVITKNVTLSTAMTEKLTSVKHCNGQDIWVLAHKHQSNIFECFLVSNSGVTNTVTTAIGSTLTGASFAGNMKVSPNGKKIGLATYQATTFELFDFDASTGVVSNSMVLVLPGTGNTYGCEFSPDGTKFYGTKENGTNNLAIYQWDLCAGSPTAIAASVYTLAVTSQVMGMQIGIDGKIYVSRWGQQWLGVISNPNVYGSGFNYTHNGFSLSPKSSGANLPNFITSGFKSPPPPFTHTVSNAFGCQTASFTAPSIAQSFSQVACAANGYSLTGIKWLFGDPASGSANTSTLTNPSHAFTTLGTYTTQLVIYYSCGGGTDTIKQIVTINQPCISVTSTSITCANLGSATVQATGGIGPYSYTWMPTAQTTSVATGLSPGAYTLTVFDFGNNFTYTAQTVFTSLIPLTANINFGDSVACFGAATATGIVTNIAGGSSNQSFSWSNGLANYTTAATNSLSAGIWTITVTDALTGCVVKQTFFIQQPPALSLSVSASSPSVCLGGSIVLTGTTGGGSPAYTYTWANAPAGGSHTVSESSGGQYQYILQSRDAKKCLVSNSLTVNFVNPPAIAVNDVSVCPQAFGTLIASGATTYTWSNNTNSNSLADNPNTNTSYTVYGSALGCSNSAVASIVLHPSPVPVIAMPTDVCQSRSVSLSGLGGTNYSWTGPSAFNANTQNVVIQSAALNQSGTYVLFVTSADGCTATASATLQVHPTPGLIAGGTTVCIGQTLSLTASSLPSVTYQWKGPQNFSSQLQNPAINNSALNHSGTYSVNVTSAQGCTNSATTQAQVVPPPSPALSLSNQTLCSQPFNGSSSSITLTASGAVSYTLVTGPELINTNPSGPVTPLTVVPPYSGIASATLFGSNGVCTESTSATFSIIPNPTVLVNTAPVICAGDSYTFTSQGASSYKWSSATVGFTTYNNGGVAIAKPIINSVFSVVGNSLGCFSATKISTITVNPLPKITISPTQPTVCLYKSVQLTASGTATAYIWTSAPGLFSGTGSNVNVSPLSQQVYTVTGELANCFASVTTTVDVLALPEPTINTAKDTFCKNENITLSGEGGLIYEWRGPLNLYYRTQVISSGGASATAQQHLLPGGVYSLTVTDGNGCQATTTKQITVYELPQGSLLGYQENGCVPLCSEYDFKINGSNGFGVWTINNQTFGDKFEYCYTEPGTYTLSGTINDNGTGCENYLDFVVTVYPKPEADFNYLPVHPIESLDEVNFTNTSSGENQTNWNWYFMNNNGYQSSEENTSYLFSAPGEYPVAFVVTDQNYCQDTVMKVVKVEPDFTLYIPDAFTPNGDGLNDVFLPVTRSSNPDSYRGFTLSVFDRWGQKIFYSTSPKSGWEGTYQGAECKMDVYNYQIILSTVSGEKKEYTGHVSLVR